MGTSERRDDPPTNRRRERSGGFRWECPVCDRAQVNRMSEEGRNARQALEQHILVTDGNGHGEAGEFPPGVRREDLWNHVAPVED